MVQTIGNGRVSLEINKINTNFSSLDTSKITYYSDTSENWATKTSLISIADVLYIYTNSTLQVIGIKMGDGTSYVVDLPFISVTPEERNFWNNKVRCYLSASDTENLIFTTN